MENDLKHFPGKIREFDSGNLVGTRGSENSENHAGHSDWHFSDLADPHKKTAGPKVKQTMHFAFNLRKTWYY